MELENDIILPGECIPLDQDIRKSKEPDYCHLSKKILSEN